MALPELSFLLYINFWGALSLQSFITWSKRVENEISTIYLVQRHTLRATPAGGTSPPFLQIMYFAPSLHAMFNLQQVENKIRSSDWWLKAATTVDSHYCNSSGVMLTHHLLSVHENMANLFQQPEEGFYGNLFALVRHLQLDKQELEKELKVVALLHDIGKTSEDKSLVIPHPLTGKPAHKRHGLVSLMAAMEILATEFPVTPAKRNRIYRTIELHDMSYGLFREHRDTSTTPSFEQWAKINTKIHPLPGAGLLYLLLFKLADTHGHDNISDVLWFYQSVKVGYFDILEITLPIPTETDIR